MNIFSRIKLQIRRFMAINVQRHGVVGDGKTCDEKPLQKIIEMAESTGKLIFMPFGSYRVNKYSKPFQILYRGGFYCSACTARVIFC